MGIEKIDTNSIDDGEEKDETLYCRVVMKPNQRGPAALEGIVDDDQSTADVVYLAVKERTVAGIYLKECEIVIPRENISYMILSDEPISKSKVD